MTVTRRYYTPSGEDITRAVEARPFEVQLRGSKRWGTIPGAYHATKAEAENAIQLRLDQNPNAKHRIIDARQTSE